MVNVRLATQDDRYVAITLAARLLSELGGTPPSRDEMAPVFDLLVEEGGNAGFIVLGEDEGKTVAVCTVSFLDALRARGRYAIIQEMFVEPAARSSGAGAATLQFALKHATAMGCSMVELGTPFNGDRQIAFYQREGFINVGARLRWRPM